MADTTKPKNMPMRYAPNVRLIDLDQGGLVWKIWIAIPAHSGRHIEAKHTNTSKAVNCIPSQGIAPVVKPNWSAILIRNEIVKARVAIRKYAFK